MPLFLLFSTRRLRLSCIFHIFFFANISIINISLSTSNDGVDPDACSGIGCSLQVITSSLCFHNESTMRSSTLRCIQMIQIHLIDGLEWIIMKLIKKICFFFHIKSNLLSWCSSKCATRSEYSFSFVFQRIEEQNLNYLFNLPKNMRLLLVFVPIYLNNKSMPFFVDRARTIVWTIHGMWHPICADICKIKAHPVTSSVAPEVVVNFVTYPRQLNESTMMCGHNVTWWPALSMCKRKSKSADIIGKYRVNGRWCFGRLRLLPATMRPDSLFSLDIMLPRWLPLPLSSRSCIWWLDDRISLDDLNGLSLSAS